MSPSVESSQLRSKAVYALSGLCKHNVTAVKQLEEAGGWEVFRLALEGQSSEFYSALDNTNISLESDINVRRKTVFLLNSLLIPSGAETTEAGDRLHTQASAPAPIHPNSHASLLRDPTSMETSHLTLKALEEQGLLITLLNALAAPIPYGVDGESHGDADFEEKGVR
jgi:hsp70-interacting protein